MGQTLGQIKALLASHGVMPKKRFGQNFLHDQHQMDRIIAASELASGERVLEVGPGTGALSVQLLDAGAQLVAVEIDRDMQAILGDVLAPYGERATLICGDILEHKHALSAQVLEALGDEPFKMIANLPYNIASPLLANVVAMPNMKLSVVMVQKEVAQRLAAKPGGKDYGPVGVMVQAFCHVQMVATLSPGCFWPAPEVDSAVVKLTPRDEPMTRDADALERMLQKLFSQRRKQLGRTLGREHPLIEGVTAQMRPEQLSVEQLVSLSKTMPSED